MKKLFVALQQYFIPASYYTDEQELRKARIFINTTLLTAVFALFYLVICYIIYIPALRMNMVVCAIGFTGLAFLFRAGASRRVCGNLYITIATALTVMDAYMIGGHFSFSFAWIYLGPVISLLFGNARDAWGWLAACVGCVCALPLLRNSNYEFPFVENSGAHYLFEINSLSGMVICLFVIVQILEKAFVRSIHALDQRNREKEEINVRLREQQAQLSKAHEELSAEKHKSDELLANILPAEVMEELKATGKTEARSYELVTVLFVDFVDFTQLSQQMGPQELVSGIDEYFEAFDHIVEAHGVEKIKTVGDAYICVSGLPEKNTNNPVLITEVALDMAAAVRDLRGHRLALGKLAFDARFGIHSGPVVAGVVGIKKFAYDIWGDTVNTAARMQQHGAAGRINISGDTYALIKDHFRCEARGKIEAKHKGAVEMYFVADERVREAALV